MDWLEMLGWRQGQEMPRSRRQGATDEFHFRSPPPIAFRSIDYGPAHAGANHGLVA